MSGFAKYTSKDNFRLKESPFYRKGARGPDPIKSFVARSYATYSQKADRIRDARFAKSNELSRDYAVRNKREQMLSEAYMNETDPVKLEGLHSRLKLKLSRTGGAMSDGTVKVITKRFRPRSNAPVAPVATRQPASHGSPSAFSGVETPTDTSSTQDDEELSATRYASRIANLMANKELTQAQSMLADIKSSNRKLFNSIKKKLKAKGFKVATPKAKKRLDTIL
jgi:hypothetical protein